MSRRYFFSAALALLSFTAYAAEAPHLVHQNGHDALFVDGAPYLVLGAQINNSSSWASRLPEVWPALEDMHVNTAEAPVYWEQLEPSPGKFDFSTVDMLVKGAREHHLHLVILWFGTWKNGNMHYVPEWVKTDTVKYPRVINPQGEPIDVLSANSNTTRDADKTAFAALMHHLAEIDGTDHTVIMMQVENESGIVGTVRDFSPMAQKEFDGPVPQDLLTALHKKPGTWREVFGGDADETFQAYYQSRYINTIAEAGKREFQIPMYCNVWVTYPVAELPERQTPNPGIGYPSGGPVQKMLNLWKAMAPYIDLIGPDMYSDDSQFYQSILDTYHRPDNPLWIPETGRGDSYARYFFYALGRGAIGFSPFGIDRTGWGFSEDPKADNLGPKLHTENYALLAPIDRTVAKLNFEGKLKTAVEEPGAATQELDFPSANGSAAGQDEWQAAVRFGFPQKDGLRPPGTPDHHGRALVAEIAPNEFLITGVDASIAFHQPGRQPGLRMQILHAEEGVYETGTDGHETWHMTRLLNGDQTDRGINFRHTPTWVHIKVSRF